MQPTAAMSPSLNFLTALPDFDHAADDFMTGDAGIDGRHRLFPLVANQVQIGVTDAAEKNFDLNVVRTWRPARDGERRQRRGRTLPGVSLCSESLRLGGKFGIGGGFYCCIAHVQLPPEK